MAGELREWADIDRAWLQNYLEEHKLAGGFDLDDELIGSQVSWILNTEEWAKLRGAWQEHQRSREVLEDAAQAAANQERPATTEAPLESASAEPAEAKLQTAESKRTRGQEAAESTEEARVSATEYEEQLEEGRRLNELTQKALSDWGAFKELFRDCPDSAGVGSWETLADSPLAMIEKAEKLILVEEARAEGEKQQLEREFEDDVDRAQNIIAGYYLYCRKNRIRPSLEHMLVHIPQMRTGYSPEAVREAWRREAEHRI